MINEILSQLFKLEIGQILFLFGLVFSAATYTESLWGIKIEAEYKKVVRAMATVVTIIGLIISIVPPILSSLNINGTNNPVSSILIDDREWAQFEQDSIIINTSNYDCKIEVNTYLPTLRTFYTAYQSDTTQTEYKKAVIEQKDKLLNAIRQCRN